MADGKSASQLIKTVRADNVSRRRIADATGLTEGAVWRIENKERVSDTEYAQLLAGLDAIRNGLDTGGSVSSRSTRVTSAPGTPVAPGGKLTDDGDFATSAAGAGSSTPSSAGPATPADAVADTPLVVDWGRAFDVAQSVSEHDIERAKIIGPNRAGGFKLVSNSEVTTFLRCRRKWWLTYVRELAPRQESPVGNLAIGGRIHSALRAWYVPDDSFRVDPRVALERLIVEDWTKLVNVHGPDSLFINGLKKQFDAEATLERAMISGYVDWLAETGADADLEITASEMYREVDITHLLDFDEPTKLIAKFDVRARRRTDNVRVFIDHKSTSSIVTSSLSIAQNPQMLFYLLIEWLGTEDGEERCDGALYNMLRKVKRTVNARPPFYERIEVRHNLIELENFKQRLLGIITEMYDVRESLRAGANHHVVAYSNRTHACARDCAFSSVCPMFDDGSRAEDMLARWYESRDPLHYYESEREELES